MNISRGRVPHAIKCVLYGVEGIGKTTLASQFPEPLYIDTEGGTREYDVARMDAPTSWQMILDEVHYVMDNPGVCKTLVIDTADWAEQMCIDKLNADHKTANILTMDYGKGSLFVVAEFKKLIGELDKLVDGGINVILTAHASIRKFELPDEMGEYDRWEMKLQSKQVKAMVKEWADIVLFCNYKTHTVAADKDGKKKKATGRGQRVMYSTHHSCWDAKNRFGLAEELPLDYSAISQIVSETPARDSKKASGNAVSAEKSAASVAKSGNKKEADAKETAPETAEAKQMTIKDMQPEPEPKTVAGKKNVAMDDVLPKAPGKEPDPHIPKELRDLMIKNNVNEWEIQNAVFLKGYYPDSIPITKYDPGFIQGVLVGAWDQVYKLVLEARDNECIPFND